jgi:hypothetical protein
LIQPQIIIKEIRAGTYKICKVIMQQELKALLVALVTFVILLVLLVLVVATFVAD